MASIGIGFLGEPAVAKLIEPVFGRALARRRGGHLGCDRLHARHRPPCHGRRAGRPSCFAIRGREHRPAARRLRSRWFRRSSAPFTVGADLDRRTAIVRLFGVRPGQLDEQQPTSEDLQLLISQSAVARQARPGRGGDAGRRLPPPRAGGTRGDDADPGGRHRRLLLRTSRRPSNSASRRDTTGWSWSTTAMRTGFAASSTR